MDGVISVIVPVYNVAAYLPQCLDSILGQDYENLEVLLIDDGSKDDSGAICDAYAARDSRIRVIHQKNGGAAAAKNAGLRVATGEFLSFVDSDDFLEPNVYGYMVELLRSTGADAAEFGFSDLYRNREEDQVLYDQRQMVSGREYLIRFTTGWTGALLWNKLYKRQLFQGVFFEEGHKIDDEYFTYQGFLTAETVVLDNRIIYHYRRRSSSVMQSVEAREQRQIDRIDALEKRRRKVTETVPELKQVFNTHYVDALIYMSEYPENTPRTIRLLKQHMWAYLTHPGNTLPPKRFWKGIFRLTVTPEDRLLELCSGEVSQPDPESYFA